MSRRHPRPPVQLGERYRPTSWDALTPRQQAFCDAYHEAQLKSFSEGAPMDSRALAVLASKAMGSKHPHKDGWHMLRNPKIIYYLNEMSSLEFMAAKSMAAQVLLDAAQSGGAGAIKAAIEILDRDLLFRKTRDLQVSHHHHVLPTGTALDDELKALLKKANIVDAEFKEVLPTVDGMPVAYVDPDTGRPVAAEGVTPNDHVPSHNSRVLKHPPKFGTKEGRRPKALLVPGKELGHEQVKAKLAEAEEEEYEW